MKRPSAQGGVFELEIDERACYLAGLFFLAICGMSALASVGIIDNREIVSAVYKGWPWALVISAPFGFVCGVVFHWARSVHLPSAVQILIAAAVFGALLSVTHTLEFATFLALATFQLVVFLTMQLLRSRAERQVKF